MKQVALEKLSNEEKKKIVFYVPKNDNDKFKTINNSYFIGSKVGIKQCITYLHAEPFFNFELRKPNSLLIIYSETTINAIQDLVIHENMKMKDIVGVDSFIKYCEDFLEKNNTS